MAKGGRWDRIRRNLVATGLVVLVLYVGIHVISRTEGARAAVADKISNGTRQPVSLEKCGATPLLGLRLKGLGFPGATLPDVKLTFNWLAFLSKDQPFVRQLRVRDAEIHLKRVPTTGNWEPLVLDGFGRRLGAVLGLSPVRSDDGTVPIFPSYAINRKTLLQLRGAKIYWHDENGREQARLLDAGLTLRRGGFVNRKAMQVLAECGEVQLANGPVLRDVKLEAFRIEGSELVVVLAMADRNGKYDEFASKTLWQDLNLHLNQLSRVRKGP